jgi:hypothetical protein
MPVYKLRPAVNTPENKVNANQTGWTPMDYSRDIIDDITEPTPGNVTDTIVSLPTPLANLDLYKRAFVTVVGANFPTTGYYAQVVSRCLDVWEGLFNFEKNGEDVTFRPWRFDRLSALMSSHSPGQRLLGRTLDLFLKSTNQDNAFLNLDGITIINYRNIPLAGTSPYTGFFFNYFGADAINWSDSKGKPLFSNDVIHLHQRDTEFQKFMYLFRIASRDKPFANGFRDFFSYINQSLNQSPIANEVRDLASRGYKWDDFMQTYGGLAKDKHGQQLELIISNQEGMQLNMPSPAFNQDIDPACQLFLKPTQLQDPNLPAKPVVVAKNADPQLKYHKRNWNDNTDKPSYYAGEFKENHATRKLPGIGLEYPYLTVGDFLDEYLINVGYPIHNKYFFTNHADNKALSYLLPLKSLFFNYFKPEDLVLNGNGAADKPSLHITSTTPDLIKVELRLPIVGNTYNKHISLVRYYGTNSDYSRDEVKQNQDGIGQVRDARIGLTIFPFQITDNVRYNDFYKVTLSYRGKIDTNLFFLDPDGKQMVDKAKFAANELGIDKLGVARKDVRAEKDPRSGAPALYIYEVRNTYPAAIRLEISSNAGPITGYILPNWQVGLVPLGSKEANFAVDFGTTNSHIAYTIGSVNVVNTLTYTPDDNMIIRLDAPEKTGSIAEMYDPMMGGTTQRNDILDLQRRALMPSVLGKDKSQFGFPARTAIVEKKAFGVDTETSIFGSQAHQFTYQTWASQISDQTFTNLKWSEEDRNPSRIKALIMQWMYMMRTIAIKEGAHPGKVKITRFVPNSMPLWQRNNFEAIWADVAKQVLSQDEPNVLTLSESEAPFHKHNLSLGVNSTTLSIDIGGGTTDTLLISQSQGEDNIVGIPDSFYFAGNSLYGEFQDFLDPSRISKTNGLLNATSDFVLAKLKSAVKDQLSGERLNYFEQLLRSQKERSDDVIDFMFRHPETGFADLLKGQTDLARQMRAVYLLHIGAILYYSGAVCRSQGIQIPSTVLLSGTASKYLTYITPNPAAALKAFATIMLTKQTEPTKLVNILHADRPKEATCEGGLVKKDNVSVASKPKPFFGNEWGFNAGQKTITYGELTKATYQAEKAMVLDFYATFVAACKAIDAIEVFNIKVDFEAILQDIETQHEQDTTKAVKERSRFAQSADATVVETTFFYPIMGAIDRLLKGLPIQN